MATNTKHLLHGVLQDFVKLAKWEDRGYHALKQSTEKAQRQLHKLQRQAATALQQPSAAVLAGAAKAMGMADLAAPEAVGADAAKRRKKADNAAAPTEQELIAQVSMLCCAAFVCITVVVDGLFESCAGKCARQGGGDVDGLVLSQAAQDAAHWQAFCMFITAGMKPSSAGVGAVPEAQAQDGTALYRQRIPQLAQRMRDVLAASLEGVGPASGLQPPPCLPKQIASKPFSNNARRIQIGCMEHVESVSFCVTDMRAAEQVQILRGCLDGATCMAL